MPPPASSPGSPPSPSSMLCAPGFIEGLLQVKETLQKDLWREPNKGELAEATSMSGLSEKNTWTIKPVNDILDWLSANFGFQIAGGSCITSILQVIDAILQNLVDTTKGQR
ncbi:uncharacterized protein LOC112185976 [Rosa chinensis]|uniref:uncharacterized protein LOC112202427 n=1 Tax=Rosa chinensis TaxID=74649 RepID=UPI001AD8EC6C|nr:uncharacterized protein LOC112202427 [Rosa chinensis]XP_040371184.1 uncharacterized protein LOC112185976 [Rosa chinensis]XP_040371185.1 uncharacterized protein LOC112185976 [Rosa chinensis]